MKIVVVYKFSILFEIILKAILIFDKKVRIIVFEKMIIVIVIILCKYIL